MVILVVLAILWAPYLVALLVFGPHPARTAAPSSAHPAWAEPSRADLDEAQDGLRWSALDDRQLTRLLLESAPRSTGD